MRKREEIASDYEGGGYFGENDRLLLEVLLDIRDLLNHRQI